MSEAAGPGSVPLFYRTIPRRVKSDRLLG
jgi:hypothetical protein